MYGHSDLDVGALLRSRPGSVEPQAGRERYLGAPRGSLGWEVGAWVFDGDSVRLELLANGSHFGVSFRGRASGDSIVGRWVEYDALDCYPSGPAVLWPIRE